MSADDDRPYRHHSIKQYLISWISRSLFGNLTYTVRRGLIKGKVRKGGLSWIPEFGSVSLTPEQQFLVNLDLTEKIVFDVGAYEGLLTLFFAERAQRVVCYEPNPRSLKALRKNLELNGIENVNVRSLGLGDKPRVATIIWNPSMAGAATLEDTSMALTIGSRKRACQEEIRVTTIDHEMMQGDLPLPDLIKIDVDGYELPVLQGAGNLLRRSHPALFIEMHGETINEKRINVRAIVRYLIEMEYNDILHLESNRKITLNNCELALRGHLYVTKCEKV